MSFFTFEDLYANKFKEITGTQAIPAKDWTNKLDIKNHDAEFNYLDYGQTNIIKYKDVEGGEKNGVKKIIKSEGEFYIDDHLLDLSKTLFELQFSATEEAAIDTVTMAKIRIVSQGELGSHNLTPRLLLGHDIQVQEMNWAFRDQIGKGITKQSAHVANFNDLGMDKMIEEYRTLEKGLLTRCRMLTEWFYLEPLDLVDFDFSIPIYLANYNCFFYVNRIINYKQKRLTQVELVALRPIE